MAIPKAMLAMVSEACHNLPIPKRDLHWRTERIAGVIGSPDAAESERLRVVLELRMPFSDEPYLSEWTHIFLYSWNSVAGGDNTEQKRRDYINIKIRQTWHDLMQKLLGCSWYGLQQAEKTIANPDKVGQIQVEFKMASHRAFDDKQARQEL